MINEFNSLFAGQPFFAKIGFTAPLPKKLLDAVFLELRSSKSACF